MVKEGDEAKLRAIEVKDSKLLTKSQREDLFDKIKDISYKHFITKADPEEIDRAVNGEDNMNLNILEAKKTAEIIDNLKPKKVIIDLPSNNKELYGKHLFRFLKNKDIEIIMEHKADMNYPVVSAASIIAKVTRDNEIEKIKKKIKIDFGSGYPADPKTVKFLEKYHEEYQHLFRKSWASFKKIKEKKFQSNLKGFSDFVNKKS